MLLMTLFVKIEESLGNGRLIAAFLVAKSATALATFLGAPFRGRQMSGLVSIGNIRHNTWGPKLKCRPVGFVYLFPWV
jgi:hypothetical protein